MTWLLGQKLLALPGPVPWKKSELPRAQDGATAIRFCSGTARTQPLRRQEARSLPCAVM